MAWTPTGTHVAITLVDLAAVADKLLRRSTKHSQSQNRLERLNLQPYTTGAPLVVHLPYIGATLLISLAV